MEGEKESINCHLQLSKFCFSRLWHLQENLKGKIHLSNVLLVNRFLKRFYIFISSKSDSCVHVSKWKCSYRARGIDTSCMEGIISIVTMHGNTMRASFLLCSSAKRNEE